MLPSPSAKVKNPALRNWLDLWSIRRNAIAADAQDEFGDTPLDIAERNGQIEIEEYFFQLGQY